jgi:hypothetical protein
MCPCSNDRLDLLRTLLQAPHIIERLGQLLNVRMQDSRRLVIGQSLFITANDLREILLELVVGDGEASQQNRAAIWALLPDAGSEAGTTGLSITSQFFTNDSEGMAELVTLLDYLYQKPPGQK